ncbi:MAG TPA: metallophosphoesterase [Pyrinomonadaceae bacterium]|nr:metallophosphoesterase [Pyrinomonadaceae bacterium]
MRRKLRIALGLGALLVLSLGLWAFWFEPASLRVRAVSLKVPRWQAEHQGLRIAVLTDLHVGAPHMKLDKLREVVERTNREQPDLVLILGDLVIDDVVGGTFVEPEPIAVELGKLRAPHGTIAVLGNHDWWNDGERITKALRQAGLSVLENESRRIERGGKSFWVAGVADAWTRKPDIAGSLAQTDGDSPVILITHNPDIFPEVPPRVSLTLAGHTHGGQVNFPLVGRPVVPSRFGQRYASGHIVEDGRHLFVGDGIGTSIIPVRFRVPPQIVILTLWA